VIRAVDASENRSPAGGPACLAVPDTVPPSTPTGVVAGTNAPDRMSILWNPSTDDGRVASYELFRDGVLVATAERPFASDAGLATLHEYCYALRAVDGAGNRSGLSETACGRTSQRVTRREEEAALRVDARTAGAVTLSWDRSSARDAIYRVYTDHAQRIGSTSALTFTHIGLEPATAYCYSVVVVHRDGREDPHGEACTGLAKSAAHE
jgi:predicted phage tail protein